MVSQLARSVMVTGSNRGLGLEMVRQLVVAENPPDVIIATCRNPDKAAELQVLAKNHKQIKILQFDVVDYNSLPRITDEVKAAVGDKGLNLLVNNAGIFFKPSSNELRGVPFDKLEPDMFRQTLETNTIAPFMLTKAMFPQLKVAGSTAGPKGPSRAMVVNISSLLGSMGAFKPRPDVYDYRASKAALNMVTKTLAEDSALKEILFVAIHPGWVSTDMGTALAPLTPEESVSQILNVIRNVKVEQNGLMLSYDGSVLPW